MKTKKHSIPYQKTERTKNDLQRNVPPCGGDKLGPGLWFRVRLMLSPVLLDLS